FKRRDLFSWLFAFIAGSISEFLRLISQEDYDIFYLTGLIFSSLTLFLIIVAVSYEYYNTFKRPFKSGAILVILQSLTQLILSISLQVIIGVLLVIALFLNFRIYLRKKTPTHAFLCFILISGILNLVTIALRDAGVEGAEEFFLFSSAVMATNIFLTGIVALIEDRLINSETKYRIAYNRAEFYKDLFVHDINNILQNLEFSLEIIFQEALKQENKKISEMVSLAKLQVNRGAELGVNVRKLSDLESGKINIYSIEVEKVIEKAVEYVKARFLDKEVSIDVRSLKRATKVNANEVLYDVFRILLNNAIRYNNHQKVELTINISEQLVKNKNYTMIEFEDNGIGIPDKMKKNLFQNIYDKPKSHQRIGLGLLLVREVINSFNGIVWAENRVKGDYKEGTNVILLIPQID
ncbi:MAG: sensor histidine kinase, partial [Candidatus Thorarchaeota archaeon]